MIAGSLEIQLLANIARLQADMNKANRIVESAGARIEKAAALASRALGLIGAGLSIREITQYSDEWQNASNQIRLVTENAEALAAVQKMNLEIANDTRSALGTTSSLYSVLARSTEELNLSQQQLAALTKTINQSFMITGGSAQAAEGAIRQLSQALDAGALRGEEYNSIIDQAPELIRAIADSLNMTKGELREFAATGGITSKIIVDALTDAADAIDQKFSTSITTFDQALVVARNNITAFVGGSDAVSQSVGFASGAIIALSNNLDEIAKVAAALATVFGVRVAASFVAATQQAVAYQLALARMSGVTATAAAGQLALASATRAAGGAMALLGGPAGVVMLGASALLYFIQQAESAEEKTARLGDEVDRLAQSLENLSIAQLDQQITEQMALIEELAKRRDALVEPSLNMNSVAYFHQNSQYIKQSKELNDALDQAAAKAAALGRARMNLTAVTVEANRVEEDAIQYYKDLADESSALRQEIDAHEKSLQQANQKIEDQIAALRQQYEASQMTARAAAIYNAVMNLGTEATAAQIVEVATLTAQLFDQEQALKDAAEAKRADAAAAEAHARAVAQAAEEASRTYRNMIENIQRGWSDSIFEMIRNTELRFDDLWKTVLDGYLRMVSEMMSKNIMDMVVGNKSAVGGIFDGIGGANSSIVTALSKIPGMAQMGQNTGFTKIKNSFGFGMTDDAGNPVGFSGDMFLEGMKTLGLNIAGAYAGGQVGNRLGESIFSKEAESQIAQQIGTAVGTYLGGPLGSFIGSTIGSMIDVAAGGDGYVRRNAGMLVGNTPGAKPGYTFDVDPFASGLNVTGFARREDQETALKIIEMFRNVDTLMVEAVKRMGGQLQVMSLAGLNEEATPGSSGTYLGAGRDADLPAQLMSFIRQLADNVTGLDQALIDSIKSADSAEQAIVILNEAVERHARLQAMEGLTTQLDAVQRAKDQHNAQTGLVAVYEQANNAVRSLAVGYQGTIEQTQALSQAILDQQQATYDLTTAYLQTQGAVDSLFGGLTETITKSLMDQTELYDYERAQVTSLVGMLDSLTDPEALYSTAQDIERRLAGMWGRLGEDAQREMGPGFKKYVQDIWQTTQEKLAEGLAAVEQSQADTNRILQISMESAAQNISRGGELILEAAYIIRQSAQESANSAQYSRVAGGREID